MSTAISYLRERYERLVLPRIPYALRERLERPIEAPRFLRDLYGRAMLRPLLSLFATALLVRLALTPLWAYLPGGLSDETLWKYWMQYSHDNGILNIFNADFVNYIGYQWVLWLLAIVYGFFGGSYTEGSLPLHMLVKTPAIFFDMLLIVTVYAATLTLSERYEQLASRRKQLAITAAAVIAFQPAVLYDGAVWSQTDSAVAASMLASIVLAARGRIDGAWAVLALGFLVKPQPVIIMPVLVVMSYRAAGRGGVIQGALVALVLLVITLEPWLAHGDGLHIGSTYKDMFAGEYSNYGGGDRLSASAWNFWWFKDVATHPQPSDAVFDALPFISYRVVGLVLSICAGLIALLYLAPRPRLHDTLIAAAYIAFAFYMLPISTHERYLFPFLALLLPVVMVDRGWLRLYVPASITFFLNLIVVAPPIEALAGVGHESMFSLMIAAVNCGLFLAFTGWIVNAATKLVPRQVFGVEEARTTTPVLRSSRITQATR